MPKGKWIWPLAVVSVFIFTLSLRQLSDPDLGFHLKYGKWIVTNERIPVNDLSTYTVSQQPYIDLHWLFQVVMYSVFTISGYRGISLFICLLSLGLSLLLLLRLRSLRIPQSISCIALFVAFLIIDPRIAPRPEMFTFMFLSGMLLILDCYMAGRRNLLFMLPAIMLIWCNIHALFILGLLVITVYFISISIREGKPDKKLLLWLFISLLVCFINPYGFKSFSLPIELLTRFDPDNIYNQHIQEFMPFFSQSRFVTRDYLFMMLIGIATVTTFLTTGKRRLHELILLVLFGFLAIGSLRNIPLFVLIATPIISKQACELPGKIRRWRWGINPTLYILMILLPAAMIPRLITNSYYLSNNSFNKTGMGLNPAHQPVEAVNFLLNHKLTGRILNSIGFGGWLSWALPQPVFIDGRLEVMKESVYQEITDSWHGGLSKLIKKYQPQLIIYNHLKYYPWTLQLKEMHGWRLIYADGLAAIFASNSYTKEIPELKLSQLPPASDLTMRKTFNGWWRGFYRQTDYLSIDRLHLGLLRLQLNSPASDKQKAEKAVKFFNTANDQYSKGEIHTALANYDTAILLQPDYAKAFNNRGILKASALSDFQGAFSDFDKAIELDPGYSDAYLGRGTAYFLMNKVQAACNDWNTACSLGNTQSCRLIKLHCSH